MSAETTTMTTSIKFHSSLDRRIQFSVGQTYAKGTGDPEPRAAKAIDLLLSFRTHVWANEKTDVQYLAPGIFPEGSPRQIAYAQGADIMLFDFDGPEGAGDLNRWIAGKLAELRRRGVAYAAATSYSHGKKGAPLHSRWRILLPASRTIQPDEFLACWLHWASFFECRPDKSQCHIASVFYPPSRPRSEDGDRLWTRVHTLGAAFDVDAAFESGKKLRKEDLYPSASKPNDESGRRARALRPDSSRPSPETTTYNEAGDLPADTVFRTPGGDVPSRSMKPGQKIRQIHSLWRKSLSGNPSCVATCHADGRVYVFDWGDSTGRWVNGWVDSFVQDETWAPCLSILEETEVDAQPSNYRLVKLPVLPAAPGNYFLDQVSLEEIKSNEVNVFSLPMGAGKTSAVKAALEGLRRVLVISDSIALSRTGAADLGCVLYSDIPHGKEADYDRVVVCINSAHRFASRLLHEAGQGWDAVVLDESPSIMSALHSDIMRDGERALRAIEIACATADQVFLCSADHNAEHLELMLDVIQKYRKDRQITHYVRPAMPGTRVCDLYTKTTWQGLLLEDVRDHVSHEQSEDGYSPGLYVWITSQEKPGHWAKKISEIRPDLKVLEITAKNSQTKRVQVLLADPIRMQQEYDVLIFSPSVKNGVSLTLPMRRVYQSISTALPGRDILQATMRPRTILDHHIRLTVSGQWGSLPTDPTYLQKVALGLGNASETSIAKNDVHWDYQPDGTRAASNPLFARSWTIAERELRHAHNHLLRTYVQHATRHGFIVNDLTDEVLFDEKTVEDTNEAFKRIKKELSEEHAREVVAAVIIDDEEAERINQAHTVEEDEALSLERYKIEQFYGPENPVTTDLVLQDKKGKTRGKIKMFNLVLAQAKGLKQVAPLMDRLDIYGPTGNTPKKHYTEYKHYALRTKLLEQIVRTGLGVGLGRAHGHSVTASEIEERIRPLLADPKFRWQANEILGHETNEKTKKNAVRWFCNVLKSLHIQATLSRPRGDDGERVRTYTISTEEATRLGKHNYIKLIDRVLHMRALRLVPQSYYDDLLASIA